MTIYIRPDGTISDRESGFDFEDQKSARFSVCYSLWKQAAKLTGKNNFDSYFDKDGMLKPDTIIENVDVETEVWTDTLTNKPVLRIKDKQ